jgi:predicted dehydrogenase
LRNRANRAIAIPDFDRFGSTSYAATVNDRVRWGVLGVANIAVRKVVPAMQRGAWSSVAAIASRDVARAAAAANALGVATAYGSYDELLDDPTIEAVYIPLPNHLHVPWAIRAVDRGKHVLCEKPIALSAREAATLIAARDRNGVMIQEAFMIRAHPQWQTAVGLARDGALGRVQSIIAHFSYHNVDPRNVRNIPEMGGGGVADIGCYLVHAARWILGREPRRVAAVVERDPVMGVDRLASMLMDFGDAQAIATCGTQMAPSQRVHILGDKARLEIEIPFNAPPDRACRIFLDDGASRRPVEFPICDQYTLQGDAFSEAIRGGGRQLLPLEDSLANMRVLDAVIRSGSSGDWQSP